MRISTYVDRLWNNWPVKTLALAVAVLLFFFNQVISLDETVLSVALEVATAENLAVADELPETVRVRVRGDESVVQMISASDFVATVRAADITVAGEYRLPVFVERRTSARDLGPLDLFVEPDSVRVTLDDRVTETVRVVPEIRGFPARGYELVQTFVTPAEVEIEGPKRFVDGRETVATEPIDLSGRTSSFTLRLSISPPNPFIAVRGGSTVEYRAVFQPRIVGMTFTDVPIDILSLFPGLSLAGVSELPSVEVEGPLLDVEQLVISDIRIEADLAAITQPGSYTVPLEVTLPDDVSLIAVSPSEVTVEITGLSEESEDEGES